MYLRLNSNTFLKRTKCFNNVLIWVHFPLPKWFLLHKENENTKHVKIIMIAWVLCVINGLDFVWGGKSRINFQNSQQSGKKNWKNFRRLFLSFPLSTMPSTSHYQLPVLSFYDFFSPRIKIPSALRWIPPLKRKEIKPND